MAEITAWEATNEMFSSAKQRESPDSKKWGYFVYPAYSSMKICVATDAS